jgi:hypothetical protein
MKTTTWTKCSSSLPDADVTVLTYVADSNEPIWPGYHNGDQWMDTQGYPMDRDSVTHWMEFPEPPESV